MSVASARRERDLSGQRLGRYDVLVQLASGGMGTVYAARAQGVAGFERLVAIKVLHPHLAHDDQFISMFLDEARLAASIRHPNVVSTLDISGSRIDGYFLVMEYVEGDHLASVLRGGASGVSRISPPIVLRIVIDALEGLAAAHRLTDPNGRAVGLVHRDLSPHNVLVGTDGIARITDFGVAKANVRLASTRAGESKGKLAYMAPEQAATGTTDQRSDLFSMGIVMWELLTGLSLFRAEHDGELLNRLLYVPIPAPSEHVPDAAPLDGVLRKALSRDPAGRYQTASELAEAIELVAPEVGGVASTRALGKFVREWLGPKIEVEAGRIRTALASLGRPAPRIPASSCEPPSPYVSSVVLRMSAEVESRTRRYAQVNMPAVTAGGAPRDLIAMSRRTPRPIDRSLLDVPVPRTEAVTARHRTIVEIEPSTSNKMTELDLTSVPSSAPDVIRTQRVSPAEPPRLSSPVILLGAISLSLAVIAGALFVRLALVDSVPPPPSVSAPP